MILTLSESCELVQLFSDICYNLGGNVTHIPHSRMRRELRKHCEYTLGPSPRPYNYNSEYAKERYQHLCAWKAFEGSAEYRSLLRFQTREKIKRNYAQNNKLPRFQSPFQIESFTSNVEYKLNSYWYDEPEYPDWDIGFDDFLAPHDLRFWTVKQRIAYRDDWFLVLCGANANAANEILDQLTYDQRESMGLLSMKEFLKLKGQRRDLYESLYDPIISGYTVDHKPRNRMTSQKSS